MLKDALGFQGLTRREAAGLVEDVDALSWGFELGQEFDLGKHVSFRLVKFSKTPGGYVVLEGDVLPISAQGCFG